MRAQCKKIQIALEDFASNKSIKVKKKCIKYNLLLGDINLAFEIFV